MATLLKKIIHFNDKGAYYDRLEWNLPKPEYFNFIAGSQVRLMPINAILNTEKDQKINSQLFTDNIYASISLNL